ncbi:unnamed protein product, partial [Prunus brigantina]
MMMSDCLFCLKTGSFLDEKHRRPHRSAGEVIVTSVISAGDLELPSVEEDDETLAEPTTVEDFDSSEPGMILFCPLDFANIFLFCVAESPPPPTRSKRLRKRTVVEYVATEDTSAVPTATSGTDDELREAFEEVEKDKVLEELERVGDGSQEKSKTVEEEVSLWSTDLLLSFFFPISTSFSCAVEVPRSASVPAVVTSPLKPPIVAMPIHSLPGSSATASFADPELAEFEAMDLDAQLDKLEKLSSPP